MSKSPVLVVDDNLELAGLLGTLIGEQGFLPLLAHNAADGLAMFERYSPVALVVDLLLPDLTGQRLLDKLQKRGPLPPVFVMTGIFKGPAQQEKLRAQLPIQGWFEKPFDTRLLVEAIMRTVGRPVIARRDHQPVGKITQDFEIDIQDAVDEDGVRARSSDDLEISIDLALMDEVQPTVDLELSAGRDNTPTPADVSAELRSQLRTGTLAETSLPRLLFAFWLAQETGEIVFEQGAERKVIYFEAGRPVFARSNVDRERLGAVARRTAGLAPSEIDRALELAKASDRPLGQVLVELGLIDPAFQPELLREQTRSIILGLFAWREGRYWVGFHEGPSGSRIELKESLPALVLEGTRIHFGVERLRALVPDGMLLFPSPAPPFPLEELPLRDAEALLLLAATGQRPAAELLAQVAGRLDEAGGRAVLYALLCLGVLLPVS